MDIYYKETHFTKH